MRNMMLNTLEDEMLRKVSGGEVQVKSKLAERLEKENSSQRATELKTELRSNATF